jgi:glycosyltransferase involved in cell wall biosynthesis
MQQSKKIAFFITTRNRLEELKHTLSQLQNYINDPTIEFFICDDYSEDDTYDYVKKVYPQIDIFRNNSQKGLIYSRNRLLEKVTAPFAICLDDDAHILIENTKEIIIAYFKANPQCAVTAFRIFWGKKTPLNYLTNDQPKRVKGFVGCGHAWRMNAWRSIPDYPEWFEFYGEEEFAGYHLYLNNWQVNYLPEVLVHHRVDIKSRKKYKDYTSRLRKSLRAGWYLYLMFVPLRYIPRKMLYSIWMQMKLKVFKGDGKAFVAILLALGDIVINCGKIYRNSSRFSKKEWQAYSELDATKIYWNPQDENKNS